MNFPKISPAAGSYRVNLESESEGIVVICQPLLGQGRVLGVAHMKKPLAPGGCAPRPLLISFQSKLQSNSSEDVTSKKVKS